MPRNGKLVRITLALAAAGLVAALAVVMAGTASAKSASGTINGAGSTFVAPLVTKWMAPVQSQLGITLNYNAVGSAGGVDGHHQQAGRLRRERRAAVAVQPDLYQLRADPLGARRNGRDLQPRRQSPAPEPDRLGARPDLPGQDHELERPGDQEAQQGQVTCRTRRSPSSTAPTARVRRSTSPTTSRTSPARGSRRSARAPSVNWPTGEGESHSSGVAGAVKATSGAIGYADVDYAVVNHLPDLQDEEPGGPLRPAESEGHQGCRRSSTPIRRRTARSRSSIRRRARSTRNAYPICTYTYVDVQKSSGANAADLKKLIGWADHEGPELRAADRLRAASRSRS